MAMNPHPQFYHPAYICISGQSYSGKTYLLLQLLSNVGAYFDNDGRPFRKIVYCYGSQWQDIFEKFQAIGVTFHAGLPESFDQLFDKTEKPCMLIVDDLMHESQNNQFMEDMSTKGVHHEDCTLITIGQNLFAQGKNSVTIRRNIQYYILFNSLSDKLPIQLLGQRFMRAGNHFIALFDYIMSAKLYNYLLIDLHPKGALVNKEIKIRNNILLGEKDEDGEQGINCYVHKGRNRKSR